MRVYLYVCAYTPLHLITHPQYYCIPTTYLYFNCLHTIICIYLFIIPQSLLVVDFGRLHHNAIRRNEISSEDWNWVVFRSVRAAEHVASWGGGVLLVHRIGRSREIIPSLFLIRFLITWLWKSRSLPSLRRWTATSHRTPGLKGEK